VKFFKGLILLTKSEILKELILAPETLVVPDAYDPISAKIIEAAGFQAVQCSGYSYSISRGYPNELDVSLNENLNFTKSIVDAVTLPVMADGEDGYGDGEEFCNNFKRFLQTGIAGINLEDQNLWDKASGQVIVDEAVMVEKLADAIRIKLELNLPDLIINARTDALKAFDDRSEGLKAAISRANRYLELGADLVFVTNVVTYEEAKLLAKEINGPLSITLGMSYNIDQISINQCRDLGIARVSLPSYLIMASIQAMLDSLSSIKNSGEFTEVLSRKAIFSDFNLLAGWLRKRAN